MDVCVGIIHLFFQWLIEFNKSQMFMVILRPHRKLIKITLAVFSKVENTF